MDKILKETAVNLALYFKLGDIKNYNNFIAKIEEHFNFREVEAEWVTIELNKKKQSPIELFYTRYESIKSTDFKTDIKLCKNIILDIYEFKKK